ncbi:MAG: hypothetical protein ACLT1I_12415 [Mediterraneibacter faecis]
MWECPDFFALDGCQVLIVSPQFMRAEGLEFHNGNNSIYFTGDYEKETMTYTRGDARQVDYGMDFYAPQTVETTDGRRVMIAWLQSWDNFMTRKIGLTGLMTIPENSMWKTAAWYSFRYVRLKIIIPASAAMKMSPWKTSLLNWTESQAEVLI